MVRVLTIGLVLLFVCALPLSAQVQDEWTEYTDILNDFAVELRNTLPAGSEAAEKVEFHLKAGSPAESFGDYLADLSGFVVLLDRIRKYIDEIEPQLSDWHDHFDEYTPREQGRISEVNDAVERLMIIYDGHYSIAVDLLARAESLGAEVPQWRFGISGDVMAALGEAYDEKQSLGDYGVTFTWKRADGLTLEFLERGEHDHRLTNTRSQTTAARQRFEFNDGDLTLREQYKSVDGVDVPTNSRDEWLLELDFNKGYGNLGSYLRLRGKVEDRDYNQNPARSYDYNRLSAFIHHEINLRHSAELEYDHYEYDYGIGSLISQNTNRYRVGWEASMPNGVVLSADYYGTDKDYDDSPTLSYTENTLGLGARWDHSSKFTCDLRFKSIANDHNELVAQGATETGIDDFDETKWEGRVYLAPRSNLSFNLRGIYRNKDYALEDSYELEQSQVSLLTNYQASARLRLFAQGTFDAYDYFDNGISFDRTRMRAGFTYAFPGSGSVGAEYSVTSQDYSENDFRNYTLGEFQASYSKYWKQFRLRLLGSISELSQDDAASTNAYSSNRVSLELTWYVSPHSRFSVGTDYLDRDYDNQLDVTDWLMYARLGFNF
ncbi:TonB-dependent receptor [bacterium]|nr:TonB-dependent receptor [bacterium]